MSRMSRIYALLLAFLLILLTPFSVYAEGDEDDDSWGNDSIRPSKLYSFAYEGNNAQGAIHLHKSYAERGDVDLLDAFIETAEKGGSMYINAGDVKLYLSKKLVSKIAARREPVMIYVKERIAESDVDTDETVGADTIEDGIPVDVVYDVDLGVEFEPGAFKVQVKYATKNADGIRVLSIDESGKETVLKSAYGNSLVAFFPERTAFTLRITEEPPAEGLSKILVLLSGVLILLVALSAVTVVLLRRGVLKRAFLRRYDNPQQSKEG